jgi:hypothetical protein
VKGRSRVNGLQQGTGEDDVTRQAARHTGVVPPTADPCLEVLLPGEDGMRSKVHTPGRDAQQRGVARTSEGPDMAPNDDREDGRVRSGGG